MNRKKLSIKNIGNIAIAKWAMSRWIVNSAQQNDLTLILCVNYYLNLESKNLQSQAQLHR